MTVPPFTFERMTKAEAFRRACARNALRRECMLPLFTIAEAVNEELRRHAFRMHYAAAEHFRSIYDEIKAGVIAELRAERGRDFPMSAGGHWMITLRTDREFAAFLGSMGFPRPLSAMVPYGSKWAAVASSREFDNTAHFEQLP